ncbi:MAG: Stk1 family PASTA domain-containing Ser/Thr kinase [Gaiellaceae bacterium]
MATDPLINSFFDGRYRILRKLGSGGMANVYLAEDQELGRRVAIKILNDRHAGDEQFVERFRREAKNAAGLSHPNIVSIYDRGEAEGTYYIAMEYLEGRSLKELIISRGPAPIAITVDYARQILAALRFAHRNGIVHRDIKPHNILVDSEGRVKVTDFGIARAGTSQMTEAGSIIGTAQYLSPEQARGAQVDQTSDLYSLGIVLYELLTGNVPYNGDTPVEIAMKHLSATPEPPSAKRPEVPHALDSVVLRALAKDPADRYQSADEMDADLERVAHGLSVSQETEDAATTVLRGVDLAAAMPTTIQPAPTAVTQIRPPVPPPPRGYYDYDEPRRRGATVWPWLLATLLVAAAAIAGFFVYRQIQHELDQTKPIGVPYVVGLRELNAVETIRNHGLSIDLAHIKRQPNDKTQKGFVFEQNPTQDQRVDKGSFVTIYVSSGKAQAVVPDVRGETSDQAIADLTKLGLVANPHQVPSAKDAGTVLAQDPKPGQHVVKGTKVRINVSIGPTPVTVPDVRNMQYDSAASILQGKGFAVARKDVDSQQPAGVVLSQSPAPNSAVKPNSTVTLTVSKGPTTSAVPNVVGQDVGSAKALLSSAGFGSRVVMQDVTDPAQDGIVQSQDPAFNTQAKPGTTVTLIVGHYTGTTTTTPTTTPPPPPTP